MLDTRAVVEKVDQNTREVRLRTADGRELTVVAGPEVRNLAQVSAGDTVRLTYYESVVARMAEPGAGGPATTSVVTGRAPQGGKPAGIYGATTDMVVEFLAYDPASGVATFKTPDGMTQQIVVSPSMRAFAAARRPGRPGRRAVHQRHRGLDRRGRRLRPPSGTTSSKKEEPAICPVSGGSGEGRRL